MQELPHLEMMCSLNNFKTISCLLELECYKEIKKLSIFLCLKIYICAHFILFLILTKKRLVRNSSLDVCSVCALLKKKNLDARKKNLDLGASDHASDASYLSFDTTDATAA